MKLYNVFDGCKESIEQNDIKEYGKAFVEDYAENGMNLLLEAADAEAVAKKLKEYFSNPPENGNDYMIRFEMSAELDKEC